MNMYENIHAENEYHKAKNEELARFFWWNRVINKAIVG